MVNVIGTSGDDFILITVGQNVDGARGAAGDDTITNFNVSGFRLDLRGGDGDDVVNAGNGGAILAGGDGDDVLVGAVADNVLTGGDGNDTISGGVAGDTMEGNSGDDFVGGFDDVLDFRDPLSFGTGFDLTSGGAGNDTVTGGAGDTLTGGTGADLFRLDPADRGERLRVIFDLRPGQDRIEFLNLPELDPGVTLRVKGIGFAPPGSGATVLCQLIAENADGDRTILGEFGLGRFPNVQKFGFYNNIEIVNNDDPFV